MAAQNNHLAPKPKSLLILIDLARGILSFYSDILVKVGTTITVESWSLRGSQLDLGSLSYLKTRF